MSLVIRRSDKYPVGTSVKAFAAVGGQNRHHEGRPSGSVLDTQPVAADGSLTFPTLGEGLYSLYAEVGGVPANMLAGVGSAPALGTLRERIAAKRLALGC